MTTPFIGTFQLDYKAVLGFVNLGNAAAENPARRHPLTNDSLAKELAGITTPAYSR
jgi:hypothetical protein